MTNLDTAKNVTGTLTSSFCLLSSSGIAALIFSVDPTVRMISMVVIAIWCILCSINSVMSVM